MVSSQDFANVANVLLITKKDHNRESVATHSTEEKLSCL